MAAEGHQTPRELRVAFLTMIHEHAPKLAKMDGLPPEAAKALEALGSVQLKAADEDECQSVTASATAFAEVLAE